MHFIALMFAMVKKIFLFCCFVLVPICMLAAGTGMINVVLFSQLSAMNESTNSDSCISCHDKEETATSGTGHFKNCTQCHQGNARSPDKQEAHRNLVANPANLIHAHKSCGQCHRKECDYFNHSLHATCSGIVGITQSVYGLKENSHIRREQADIRNIRSSSRSPLQFEQLLADLLNRRCSLCHPSSLLPTPIPPSHPEMGEEKGPQTAALSTQSNRGCLVCHSSRQGDHKSNTHSSLVQKHTFTKKVNDSRCLTCHQSPYIGAEYHGKFGKDTTGPYLGGLEELSLQPDIHFQAGLWCIDCHSKEQIMGDEVVRRDSSDGDYVQCGSCHIKDKTTTLTLRGSGLSIPKPQYLSNSPFHRYHPVTRVRCESCHAAWVPMEFGNHFLRLDLADYYRWRFLIPQGIESIDRIFRTNLDKHFDSWESPQSIDPLTGEMRPGVWLKSIDFKRFELILLGEDQSGAVSLLRPHIQLSLSYVNSSGQIIVDNKSVEGGFDQVTPHTIQRSIVTCTRCHGYKQENQANFALWPDRWKKLLTVSGSLAPGTKGLSRRTAEKLANPSPKFKKIHAEIILNQLDRAGSQKTSSIPPETGKNRF